MARMTKPTDHTLLVLKQIRDAVAQTNERLDQTNERLDQTREELSNRLDQTRQELSRRQTETEIRLATALTDVVGAIHEVRDAVRADKDLRKTVAEHEQRLDALERPGERRSLAVQFIRR